MVADPQTRSMKSTLSFWGGVGTVTGANFLLDSGEGKVLVDCGILQQESPSAGVCGDENFAPFPYDAASIDALVVTHAHADHIGRIPRLVREGFRGSIYSTLATRELVSLMFDDALHVMKEHAERHGCEMLYEKEDAQRALSLWRTHEYHEPFAVAGYGVEFADAGHILGSATVRFSRPGPAGGDRSILFSGDLGNTPEPLLSDTEPATGANYMVVESVYGDRVHEGREDRKEVLRLAVESARKQNGVLLIPSFSIERTQVLLFELNDLIESGAMKPVPVYLDSPLAARVTDVFRRHTKLFNESARSHFERGDDTFTFLGFKVVKLTGDSRALHEEKGPMVIIAGAGMSGGGRVRAHEKHYLPQKNAAILFVGYQTPGSLGRRIQDGEKQVTIDGERIRVRASVGSLTGYSGHADREQLLTFVESAGESLERVFVTMGEPKSALFLAQRVKDFLGVDAVVPKQGDSAQLEL
jgi:metallo-beta-lactamase family protein